MMQKKWWHSSVVYQIYPKSFNDTNSDGIGDLKGIIEKLDYLEKLGVDIIWLCPIYQSPMEDNGYDISDYQLINAMFGNIEDMDCLIKKAENHGIKIIMDLVVNHTSKDHKWFKESRSNLDNPYRDYYIWRDQPNELTSTFGGPAWSYDETTKQYYFRKYAVGQPDLNWENPKVREEIYRMINWWLDKGIGGFRLDVIDKIGKDVDRMIVANGPKLHEYIQEMNRKTFGKYDVLTVGEAWSANQEIAELYSNPARQELNMVFQFEHMTIDWGKHGKFSPITLDFLKLKHTLSKWQMNEDKYWNSLFWTNHDLPRVVSRFGNEKEYRVESAKMLAILLHFMKGTPYIYQGEEIGMTNIRYDTLEEYDDVEILMKYNVLVKQNKVMSHEEFMNGVYAMSRDNARSPMHWDDTHYAGFSDHKPWLGVNQNHLEINVKQALLDENSIFYTYQKLISLRKNSPYSETIIYGDYLLLLEKNEEVFAYIRSDKQNKLLVIANFYDQETVISLNYQIKKIILANYDSVSMDLRNLTLRPYEAIVYELK